MDGIADYLHPVVLIQEEGLEHLFTREPVQLSELALRIHTYGKPEVIPLQNITQFLVVFRLEEKQERHLGNCNLQLVHPMESTYTSTLYSASGIRKFTVSTNCRVNTGFSGKRTSFPCHSSTNCVMWS